MVVAEVREPAVGHNVVTTNRQAPHLQLLSNKWKESGPTVVAHAARQTTTVRIDRHVTHVIPSFHLWRAVPEGHTRKGLKLAGKQQRLILIHQDHGVVALEITPHGGGGCAKLMLRPTSRMPVASHVYAFWVPCVVLVFAVIVHTARDWLGCGAPTVKYHRRCFWLRLWKLTNGLRPHFTACGPKGRWWESACEGNDGVLVTQRSLCSGAAAIKAF